jgi:uncharacterized membrane protein YcaP (DUF421 family)
METLITVFGEGKDLAVYQMCARAVVIYFVALLFIRISGRRTFGKKSSFDNVIGIILGAILSRAVVGASPFVPTIVSSFALVLIHRLLGMLCIYSESLSHIIKGQSMALYKNGKIDSGNLRTALMSEDDLVSDLRLKGGTDQLSDIAEMHMETSGEVSVVRKKEK